MGCGVRARNRRIHIRLLDAEADDDDWMETALLVLEIDPILEPKCARNAWQDHLSRAYHPLRRGVY